MAEPADKKNGKQEANNKTWLRQDVYLNVFHIDMKHEPSRKYFSMWTNTNQQSGTQQEVRMRSS